MKLYEENCELKERVVQQQSRSMRDNLIFKGIPDDYNPVEDTEGKIKDFIYWATVEVDYISYEQVWYVALVVDMA
jgi:hypothetical protein